jgi:hypothetical protein
MNMKSEIPVYYDDIKGWIVLSDETFSNAMLLSLRDYVYRVNSQRMKGMFGEKRLRVENALLRLMNEGLSVMTNNRDINMFQSNQKMTDTSYHFMGGK